MKIAGAVMYEDVRVAGTWNAKCRDEQNPVAQICKVINTLHIIRISVV